jgi:phage terminase large subunit GpA-like protein
MAITPVCNGDVAYHFEKIEHSWDVVKYKMIEKFPDAHDTWMSEYAKKYLNYDRTVRGDRYRASMDARKYVEDNYEMLHAGAEASWDFAFGWDEDPQTEISPIQHAYNIILDDGWEDFEYECQCNTEYGMYEDGETIHCPKDIILTRTNHYPRKKVPQATSTIVTHIDVNKDILTYATLATGDPFHPYLINYGTHPKQPGTFTKRNIGLPLRTMYPHVSDYREVLYLAVKDLLQTIAHQPYLREDGVEMFNSVIGIDVKFEEDFVVRACKDSALNALVLPTWGIFVAPDEESLHERSYPEGSRVYQNCVERPMKSRTIDYLNVDANYFKTEVHKAFNQLPGLRGSLTMFAPEWVDQHKPIGDHCNSERPEREPGKKTNRTRIVWKENTHIADNEFFDNLANCLALIVRQGIDIRPSPSQKQTKQQADVDMAEYMKSQKGQKL